ncbi:hypothetical protein PtrM4_144530 [Pyrenophora tritici-repentis]|uniref:Reverse transcriptase domain-containing protein n=1 Tax=Pyrenophora tritici-repentis TaxID=45151 RepID=A0A834RKY3_9PLEO|nr:hypothetical protein PtrM4_144530 [Pyrenophora tritici-repentis]
MRGLVIVRYEGRGNRENEYNQDAAGLITVGVGEPKIRAGIPQGSPVSPIFFLIYIRDLFPALQSFQLSYIDDLSLTTSSTSLKKNIRALQKEIATLFAKGEQLDIIFDTSKTELIHFTAKKERIERALILPNNDRIEHKDTVKWLGIYLDNRLSFKSHVSIRVSQARQAFYRLGRLANIELGLSTHAIRQLYLACVTSVSDYGAQIYWQNQPYATKKLQSLHNLACRKTLGVFRTAPTVPTSRLSNKQVKQVTALNLTCLVQT